MAFIIMSKPYAFQLPVLQKPAAPVNAKTQPQQTTLLSASGDGAVDPIDPNLVMVGCLTPFLMAFLLFSVQLTRHHLRLHRGLKRLQRITTLERTLEKTPRDPR
jgi:hypothetical protein